LLKADEYKKLKAFRRLLLIETTFIVYTNATPSIISIARKSCLKDWTIEKKGGIINEFSSL
jgi:hypothetical protein